MRKILKCVILIATFLVILGVISGIYQESKIKKEGKNSNYILQENEIINKEENQNVETTSKENNQENNSRKSNEENNKNLGVVEKEYKGYNVAANLKIDKLNIDTCVLDDYTKEAMEVCVTKFFGPNPNEIGNFCITGHNYITKNMFGYLYTLKVGDKFTLTDNSNGTVDYEIYDIYKAKPTETYGLSQRTNGKREVTLVTCCNYSNNRLIIKAKEKVS